MAPGPRYCVIAPHEILLSLLLLIMAAEYGQGWSQIQLRGRLTLFLSCSTQSVLASKPDWGVLHSGRDAEMRPHQRLRGLFLLQCL